MQSYIVAICENEAAQALYLKKLLTEYAEQNEIRFQLPIHESAEAFLFQYEDNKAVDIILLDIQMNGTDGLTMAEKLRRNHDQVKIVFITGLTEHIGAGYRVEASDYLVKPVKKEQIFDVLDRVLQSLPEEDRYVIVPMEEEQVKVLMNDIVCAEISGRELTLTTTKDAYILKWTMQELRQYVEEETFIQTDRSWLVHIGHIERVTKVDVVMDNGMNVPVSRRNVKKVTQAFIDYHRKV